MPIKIQLYFNFLLVLSFAYGRSLETKQILDSIISETSVKYLTKLAQVFAKEAAETFIKELKNKEHLFNDSMRAKVFSKTPGFKHTPTATQESVTNDDILNEEKAYKLLEKPYPDGDHLGWHSQESTFEEEDRKETRFPVHGLVKVNGVYL